MAVRRAVLLGLGTFLAGGVISAVRHEEIYIICAVAWCKAIAQIIQSAGLASWSLGVLLVGICLLFAGVSGLAMFILSIILLVHPKSSGLMILASIGYGFFAVVIGCSLSWIFTNEQWAELFKNASGPPLSKLYALVPLLFFLCSMLLALISVTGRDRHATPIGE